MYEYKHIQELQGKTIVCIEHNDEEVVIKASDGARWRMYHEQDCCESVTLDRIEGDLADILNQEIIKADEIPGHGDSSSYESVTFTDFKLTSKEGSVTFCWVGSSNGYYSESVYFVELKN